MFRTLKNYQDDEKPGTKEAQREKDESVAELKKELEELKARINRQ
jgi:hypothetical protein